MIENIMEIHHQGTSGTISPSSVYFEHGPWVLGNNHSYVDLLKDSS